MEQIHELNIINNNNNNIYHNIKIGTNKHKLNFIIGVDSRSVAPTAVQTTQTRYNIKKQRTKIRTRRNSMNNFGNNTIRLIKTSKQPGASTNLVLPDCGPLALRGSVASSSRGRNELYHNEDHHDLASRNLSTLTRIALNRKIDQCLVTNKRGHFLLFLALVFILTIATPFSSRVVVSAGAHSHQLRPEPSEASARHRPLLLSHHHNHHQQQQHNMLHSQSDPMSSPVFSGQIVLLRGHDNNVNSRRRIARRQSLATRRHHAEQPDSFTSRDLWTTLPRYHGYDKKLWQSRAAGAIAAKDDDENLLNDLGNAPVESETSSKKAKHARVTVEWGDDEDLNDQIGEDDDDQDEHDDEENEDENEDASDDADNGDSDSSTPAVAAEQQQLTSTSNVAKSRSNEIYNSLYASDLIPKRRRQHVAAAQSSHHRAQQHQVPETPTSIHHHHQQRQQQLPIVVSISDNSFVSASPVVDSADEAQRQQLQHDERERYLLESTVSTTATTTSESLLLSQRTSKLDGSNGATGSNLSGSNSFRGIFSSFTTTDQPNNEHRGSPVRHGHLQHQHHHRPHSDGDTLYRGHASVYGQQSDATLAATTTAASAEVIEEGEEATDITRIHSTSTHKTTDATSNQLSASNEQPKRPLDSPQRPDERAPLQMVPFYGDSEASTSSERQLFDLERVPYEPEPTNKHYSNIIQSPANELVAPFKHNDAAASSASEAHPRQRHSHKWPAHKASIRIGQELEPDEFHRGGLNSALIAILFGIGATGMLVLIVGHKMRSIRERVAYRGRRRSLVPDTDFLIQTIPI